MTGGKGNGPDEEERRNPGDAADSPLGTSSNAPAEGPDDLPSPEPGSPEG